MPSDTSTDLLADGSTAAGRTSAALAVVAAVALAGNCLLTSPHAFSEAQAADRSALHWVVSALGFNAAFPTWRGVEIGNLFFYTAAACLTLIAGLRLIVSDVRPRISADDLLDLRRRAASPLFWWCVLILVSVLSSTFSHAPQTLLGQTIIRMLHVAWVLPLAVLLQPVHARRLGVALVAILAATGALGLWYVQARVWPNNPDGSLQYPIGNSLWFAACLLPGAFLAIGRIVSLARYGATPRWKMIAPLALAVVPIVAGLHFTRSRSALAALCVGLVTAVMLATPRRIRGVLLVLALGGAVLGGNYVRSFRAHSIRARLDHEWPYAMVLFNSKMITGHGDGAYSLLAGSIARDDQLGDPNVAGFDNEAKWTVEAHNEFLEILADLGLVGAVAVLGILITTLIRAVRFIDSRRQSGDADRPLVIALTAALAACLADACFESSFRNPGSPAVILTVWAILWALIRSNTPGVTAAPDDQRITPGALRASGVALAMVGLTLGYFGIQDWRGVRSRLDAEIALNEGRFAQAVVLADYSAEHTLTPFRKLIPKTIAARSRIIEFDRHLAANAGPPSDAVMAIGRDAWLRLNDIENLAPRFLGVSRLYTAVFQGLFEASRRRGATEDANAYLAQLAKNLERRRLDDPFQIDSVVNLWGMNPNVSSFDRLAWLRAVLRGGDVDDRFHGLLDDLVQRADFAPTFNDLLTIAQQDSDLADDAPWRDTLAPETLRIAASLLARQGKAAEAAKLAEQAAEMYARAGGRLFAGRRAAMREGVEYAFAADPDADIATHLVQLADAWALDAPRRPVTQPLLGALGRTRAMLLAAAGRDDDARDQLAVLVQVDTTLDHGPLAQSILDAAFLIAPNTGHAQRAERLARRAAELVPDSAAPYRLLLSLALQQRDDRKAAEAAAQFRDRSTRQGPTAAEQAARTFEILRRQHPDSSIWSTVQGIADPLSSSPTTQTSGG